MYYYSKKSSTGNYYKGSGLIDSIFSAVTSQAVKEVAKDAAKTLAKNAIVEGTTTGTKKILKKINGGDLNPKSKRTLKRIIEGKGCKKNIIPIEEFVRTI